MKVKVSRQDGETHVTLDGGLVEGSGDVAAGLAAQLKGPVVMNCEKVSLINSVGVGEWLTGLKALDPSVSISYSRCSVIFVDYANMLPGFAARGRIVSFHAPFACLSCGKQTAFLILSEDVASSRRLVRPACACGGVMEPEVHEEDYLSFLAA